MSRPQCAIYTRLSKEDEDKHQPESGSIQNQKSLQTRYAIDHGWDIYGLFCDEDFSGTVVIFLLDFFYILKNTSLISKKK